MTAGQTSALGSLTDKAREAWNQSLLAQLPERSARVLAERALQQHFPSGDVLHRGSSIAPSPVYLMVDGLARVYVRSDSGREMTVRYVGNGELIGLPAMVAGRSNPGVAVKVIIDSECLSFPVNTFSYLAAHDVDVAWPIAQYIAETLHLSEQLWSNNVFQSMSARVAYHLLELCTREHQALIVHTTQEELAHAVGSVREVVARSLKDFAEAGLIERGPRTVRLLDPAGLHRIASPSVGQVRQ